MTQKTKVTDKTRLRRHPERGSHSPEVVRDILKQGYLCHLGFQDGETVFVIPTIYAPYKDEIVIHGAVASRMMKLLKEGASACITVTLVDALVLARSAFAHSMNYRSLVLFGKARIVSAHEEKMEALRLITEHLIPGRWDDTRLPNDKELMVTEVLAFATDEASVKTREGIPKDHESDYSLKYWAGLVPLSLRSGPVISDPRNSEGTEVPEYLNLLHDYAKRNEVN